MIGDAIAKYMDYPRAWKIAREVPPKKHNSKCSFAVSNGGILCDCEVITNHPEYIRDYGKEKVNK